MELPTEKIIMKETENDDAAEDLPSNMDIKYPMLAFEKQIFMDVFEMDALVVTYKGLNYNTILSNLLFLYNDPANLILVVNSSDHQEKYFMEKFNLAPLPNLGQEREKAYLEGGIHFVSTRILVVDLLKSRVPVAHITGIIVLRAHTVLESCQEAFALRLYRQHNKTGFIKAFSNAPISFTYGFHQVEKVMRALFVKELFLWPRFHGTVIKCLKSRQVELVELHIPVSRNTSLIQACLLDIMNYTVKQLRAMNRTLDMQEITTENCITKKFHKILQSQLDCVWHQLSTRTKEYIQDLKVLRTMVINLIHEDSVSFYALVSKYRTAEYAQVNSGWILLDSAEQLFRMARSRVFNSKNEFDPEAPPKWQCLSDLLLSEIPDEVRKKKDGLNNTKILVLCQDNRTCSQLNQYLTVGAGKYLLYAAFRRDVTVNAVACLNLKNTVSAQSDKRKNNARKTNDESGPSDNDIPLGEGEEELYGDDKCNYLLTLPLSVTQNRYSAKSGTPAASKEDDSRFEPLSQIEDLDITQLETEKPVVCIQSFKENGNIYSLERTLDSLRPEYIVLYHSDAAAVRQIELFESRRARGEPPTKVYFLMHDQTVEEQAYLTSLKREKQAFEILIQAKSVMVVPSYQDGKTDEYFKMNNEEEEQTPDTRKAGGQAKSKEKPLVVVDMREFRSDLPALLHKKGIHIEPLTIAIGDYILTPEICVERKSISDLIGSLNSGRLYTQCTQMCRNYSRPILLIEFDQNKPFNLQGHFVVSSDLSGADVQQKLQLLTIHFPRLKLVWSPSPYATADLFYELKQGRANPSAASALALSGERGADDMHFERYNNLVHDFVRKLPGLTSKNLPRLMNRGGSLDHIITLSQNSIIDRKGFETNPNISEATSFSHNTLESNESGSLKESKKSRKDELQKIIENKTEAEMLYSILHVKAQPADASKEEKPYAKKKFVSKFKNKK